jgi:flagellin
MASINTNIAAYYAQNNLRTAANNAQSSIARLSSGNAIVQASDDVSGLAIGTILQTDVSTLKTATSNASQATSLLQVANGALTSLTDILQRQAALATQSNSGTLSNTERGYLNQEFQQLTTEYDQIVGDTNFNGVNLLDGSISGASNLIGKTTQNSATTLVGLGSSALTAATFSVSYNNNVSGSQSGATVNIENNTAGTKDIVTVTLNGQIYTSNQIDLSAAATHSIALTDAAGDTLTLTTASTSTTAQGTATTLAASIQADLASSTAYQTREISNAASTTGAIVSSQFDGTILQGMDGNSFVLKSNAWGATSAPSISNFQITPYSSSANGSFTVNVNGDVYKATLSSATFNAGAMTFTDQSNSNQTLVVTFGQNLNVGSAAGAAAITGALNSVFGGGSNGGLSFQVGTNSTDTINVSMANIDSNSVGTNTLDISTAAGAQAASSAISTAISTVTSATSNVGALEERFNYATATLGTSIQNLDAARGAFLDTDVSSESTKFATEQVLQQAAISVLAQANQIPQNLLKLLA